MKTQGSSPPKGYPIESKREIRGSSPPNEKLRAQVPRREQYLSILSYASGFMGSQASCSDLESSALPSCSVSRFLSNQLQPKAKQSKVNNINI